MQYPKTAVENHIQGYAVVTFVANRNSTTEELNLLRDIGNGCGEESLRVVNRMKEEDMR